jgi:hypothetical protein
MCGLAALGRDLLDRSVGEIAIRLEQRCKRPFLAREVSDLSNRTVADLSSYPGWMSRMAGGCERKM